MDENFSRKKTERKNIRGNKEKEERERIGKERKKRT